jgi:hypothetical protein
MSKLLVPTREDEWVGDDTPRAQSLLSGSTGICCGLDVTGGDNGEDVDEEEEAEDIDDEDEAEAEDDNDDDEATIRPSSSSSRCRLDLVPAQ